MEHGEGVLVLLPPLVLVLVLPPQPPPPPPLPQAAGVGIDREELNRFVKRVVTLFTEGYATKVCIRPRIYPPSYICLPALIHIYIYIFIYMGLCDQGK